MDRTAKWFIGLQQIKFIVVSLLVIYVYLLPVNLVPMQFQPPNFVLLLAIALITRYPQYLPIWVIFTVFLLYDFLLYQPLGLNAFLALIGMAYLRSNRIGIRQMNFLSEWAFITLFLFLYTCLREVVLFLILSENTPFFGALMDLVVSTIYYPVALVCIALLFEPRFMEREKIRRFRLGQG
ncbi:MAG: hypothetical protein AAF429_07445 [Pseudomonadota bacterium]